MFNHVSNKICCLLQQKVGFSHGIMQEIYHFEIICSSIIKFISFLGICTCDVTILIFGFGLNNFAKAHHFNIEIYLNEFKT